MDIRNSFVIYIGIALIFLLFIFLFWRIDKKGKFSGGKKVVADDIIKNDPLYRRRYKVYRVLRVLLIALCIGGIASSLVILARPYTTEITQKEKYSRDIILTMDVSSSVDELNMKLIDELKDTVKNLEGERIGVVIFNTSPVYLVPLTDDYEYVIEQLDMVKKSIESNSMFYWDDFDFFGNYDEEEWAYYSQYIYAGTLEGSEERGSSLIGDGLATAALDFSDLDEDKERSRIIIFTTDNELEGQPFVTLPQAADICKKHNVTVYGIGTQLMYNDAMFEMKSSVESTGGKFYLEENKNTFGNIIKDIEKHSKSKIKSGTEIIETDIVKTPFIILLSVIFCTVVLTKITRR